MKPSRAPIVAFVAAGLALAVAGIAVVITLTRDTASAAPAGGRLTLDDGSVTADAVVALGDAIATATPFDGRIKGVPVKGVTLGEAGASLGLRREDVIVAASGRAVASSMELRHALRGQRLSSATTLYLEVHRADGRSVLIRREITGHPTPVADGSGLNPLLSDAFDDPVPAMVGITHVDDTDYQVERSFVDGILADPMAMAKGARVVPAIKNGKPDGFKLYAIRPDSVYAALGLKNGDTLQSINGHDLTSMDAALEAYTTLSHETSFQVVITRRGHDLTLTYTIN